MSHLVRIAGDCPDNKTCPAAWVRDDEPGFVFVVGAVVEDENDVLTKAGPGESVVRIPRTVWESR